MNILITGGNGFIGTRLVNALSKKDHKITLIDPVLREITDRSINQINCDFREVNKFKAALEDAELVIHLAALLGVDNCEKSASSTLKANGSRACKFFDLCKESGVKKIIYTSSSEVYGDIEEAKETSQVSPKSNYALAKLYSERYLETITSDSFSSIVLRLFSIYGKGQRDDFVISKFMSMAKTKTPLTIYEPGTQLRAFCHVTDLVSAVENCIDNFNNLGNFTLFNIGNNTEPITVNDLAIKILKLHNLDTKKYLKRIPLKNTIRGEAREIYFRTPSIEKSKKLIGYEPKVNLNEGLNEFME